VNGGLDERRYRPLAEFQSEALDFVTSRWHPELGLFGASARAAAGMRVPAGDIEGLALDRLRLFFSSRTEVGDVLAPLDLEAMIERLGIARGRLTSLVRLCIRSLPP
jgi:hypothetical protein